MLVYYNRKKILHYTNFTLTLNNDLILLSRNHIFNLLKTIKSIFMSLVNVKHYILIVHYSLIMNKPKVKNNKLSMIDIILIN